MEDYENKVVIVTGACGGIGEVIAREFARAGASLGLCDIRGDVLVTIVDGLVDAGTAVYSSAIDVAEEKQVRDFCDGTVNAFGGIDCLVNTVGTVEIMGDVEELSLSTWNGALATNLTSAFLTAKYATPHMKNRGGGVIVNISSVSGFANQFGAMAYSVTKAGLISLTKSEAIDLAPSNIRANSICPGSVETPLVDQAIDLMAEKTGLTAENQRQQWLSQYPTQRFTQPEEVAELALFLCSERAVNITGASFVIDGGLMALLPER